MFNADFFIGYLTGLLVFYLYRSYRIGALWIWRLGIMKDNNGSLLFSERYGYARVWRFWGLKIKWR